MGIMQAATTAHNGAVDRAAMVKNARKHANHDAAVAFIDSILSGAGDFDIAVTREDCREASDWHVLGDGTTVQVTDSDGAVFLFDINSEPVYEGVDYVRRVRIQINRTQYARLSRWDASVFPMPPSEAFGYDPDRVYQFTTLAGLGAVLAVRAKRLG